MIDKVSKLRKDIRTYIRELNNERSKMFLKNEEKKRLDKQIADLIEIEDFIKLKQIEN